MSAHPPDPPSSEPQTDDPAGMTPHQRLTELAALLAEGYRRACTFPIDAADSPSSGLEPPDMPDVDGSPRG